MIICQPMMHLPGHFKPYTTRLIQGFSDAEVEKLEIWASSDTQLTKFMSNDFENITVNRTRAIHPSVSSLLLMLKLIFNINIVRTRPILFLDYHFVVMAIMYPFLRLRFRKVIIVHPGPIYVFKGTFPLKRIALSLNWISARILGLICQDQVYHSQQAMDQFFIPIKNYSNAKLIEWGVLHNNFQYPVQTNATLLADAKLNFLCFGKIERRKRIIEIIHLLDMVALSNPQIEMSIQLLGSVDPTYSIDLSKKIKSCKRIRVNLVDKYFDDSDLEQMISVSHFVILAYEPMFKGASGVLFDVIEYGIPILTLDDCSLSKEISAKCLGISISSVELEPQFFTKLEAFYKKAEWIESFAKQRNRTWLQVASEYIELTTT